MPENTLLIEARLAQRSPQTPHRSMNREDLAKAIDAWVYSATGKETAITANYIGKLERGVIMRPMGLYREALRSVLGAETDEALGFKEADGHSRTIREGRAKNRSRPGPKPGTKRGRGVHLDITMDGILQMPASRLQITRNDSGIAIADPSGAMTWIYLPPRDSAEERKTAAHNLITAARIICEVVNGL